MALIHGLLPSAYGASASWRRGVARSAPSNSRANTHPQLSHGPVNLGPFRFLPLKNWKSSLNSLRIAKSRSRSWGIKTTAFLRELSTASARDGCGCCAGMLQKRQFAAGEDSAFQRVKDFLDDHGN